MDQMEDNEKGVFARVSDLFFNMSRKQLWIVIALVIGAAIVHDRGTEPTKIRPVLNAEPYVWPAGCPIKKIRESEDISCACVVAKYELMDSRERGLFPGGKRGSSAYYRIGNDAVNIADLHSFFKDEVRCVAFDIAKDFYRLNPNTDKVNER
jgi:hypothetical protein